MVHTLRRQSFSSSRVRHAGHGAASSEASHPVILRLGEGSRLGCNGGHLHVRAAQVCFGGLSMTPRHQALRQQVTPTRMRSRIRRSDNVVRLPRRHLSAHTGQAHALRIFARRRSVDSRQCTARSGSIACNSVQLWGISTASFASSVSIDSQSGPSLTCLAPILARLATATPTGTLKPSCTRGLFTNHVKAIREAATRLTRFGRHSSPAGTRRQRPAGG